MLDLAFKDLKEHKTRTILTAVGIITAITAIISLGSISVGVNELITSGTSQIGSDIVFVMKEFDLSEMSPMKTFQIEDMDEDEIESVRSVSGVKRAVPIISKHIGRMFFEIDGIDMNDIDLFGAKDIEFKEGTWPENNEEGIAIGHVMADSIDVSVGDYITLNKKEVEVFGIFEENSGMYDFAGIMPYKYAEKIFDMEGKATQVLIEPQDISFVNDIRSTIEEEHDDLTTMMMEDALSMAKEATSTLNVMTFGIGFVASVVAAIGIIITMYTSVIERRRQLGIMKAIGALKWTILKQILEEGLILSLISGTIAIGLSFFFVDILNNVLLGGSNIALITPVLAAGAFAYGVILTIIFSLYPARVAVKTDPIDAIRRG